MSKHQPVVWVVSRVGVNKFGWTPDLSDASRYGIMRVVFESDDRPQYLPGPSLQRAKRVMKDYNSEEDFILWGGGGDPIAVACVTAVATLLSTKSITFLRWERNIEQGVRDRRKGWYMPVSIPIKGIRHED